MYRGVSVSVRRHAALSPELGSTSRRPEARYHACNGLYARRHRSQSHHAPSRPLRTIARTFSSHASGSDFTIYNPVAERPSRPLRDCIASHLNQDPRGRIRFTPVNLGYDWRSDPAAHSTVFPTSRLMELHVVPFWTVIHMSKYESTKVSRSSGLAMARKRVSDMLEFGFSISAVADDHWCSGLILRDDLRTLLEILVNKRETDFERMLDHPAEDDGSFRLQDFERWLSLYYADLPESRFAPFAKPYPRISSKDIATLVARCEEAAAGEPDMRYITPLTDDVDIFAIPTYRLVAKSLAGGRTCYWDGLYDPSFIPPGSVSPFHFALSEGAVKLSPQGSSTFSGLGFSHIDHGRYKSGNVRLDGVDDPADEYCAAFRFTDSYEDALVLGRMAVAAQNRASLDWEDPNILPADLTPGRPNLRTLMEYATRRILRYKTGLLPRAFKPSSTDTSARASLSGASGVASMLKRVIPTRPRSTSPTSPAGSVKLKSLAGSTRPAPSGLASQSASGSRPLPRIRPRIAPTSGIAPTIAPLSPTPLQDPDGHYKALEVSPTSRMIDPAEAKTIDNALKEKWRLLQTMYHADKTFGSNTGSRSDARSLKINVAYAELKTLELRKAYSKKSIRT